jgi:hypothetical protein
VNISKMRSGTGVPPGRVASPISRFSSTVRRGKSLALRHETDAGLYALVRRRVGDVFSVEADAAAVGWQDAHRTFEQGCLAHAVAAEQGAHLARLRAEGQTAQDVATAVVLIEVLNAELGYRSR